MIQALVTDFAKVLLFPKDPTFQGRLNPLHKELSQQPEYNPLDHFQINTELLDFYASLKDRIRVYIFTSDVIQDAPEFQPFLQPVFEEIFSASKLNTHKSHPEAYKMVAAQLQLDPSVILYIDDNTEFVEAATTAGMQAIHYQNNGELYTAVNHALTR